MAADPDPPTLSRRGVLAVVGGGALLVAVLTAGQTSAGWTRHARAAAPARTQLRDGPNDFQINRTAASAASTRRSPATGGGCSCGAARRRWCSTAPTLAAMPQHTASCRSPASRDGRRRDLDWCAPARSRRGRRAARARLGPRVLAGAVRRVQPRDAAGNQVLDPDALLAFGSTVPTSRWTTAIPARIIVPALPGVHNTKWVASIEFRET